MADLSRRRFLQASVLASSAMLLPGVMQAAWAAGSDKPEQETVRIGFIPLTFCCHLSVNKQLFFCHSSMSCYLASIKRVISRIRHNKRDDNDIVTTHSFGSGTGSGFCDERNGCDDHSVLAFHGRGVG